MNHRVEIKPAVRRQIARLPRHAQVELSGLIERLSADPRFWGIKAVTGRPGVLRARLGDYRVLFKVDDARRVVVIGRVAPRGSVYKRLSDVHFD